MKSTEVLVWLRSFKREFEVWRERLDGPEDTTFPGGAEKVCVVKEFEEGSAGGGPVFQEQREEGAT